MAARAVSVKTKNGRLAAKSCIGSCRSGWWKTRSAIGPASANHSTATPVDTASGTSIPARTEPRTVSCWALARYAATNRVMAVRMPSPQTSSRIARSAKTIVY